MYVNCFISSRLFVKHLLQILFYKYCIFTCCHISKELMDEVDYLIEIAILVDQKEY